MNQIKNEDYKIQGNKLKIINKQSIINPINRRHHLNITPFDVNLFITSSTNILKLILIVALPELGKNTKVYKDRFGSLLATFHFSISISMIRPPTGIVFNPFSISF